MTKPVYVAGGLAIIALIGVTWWFTRDTSASAQITLYGNLDVRQVSLAFNSTERITEVLVDEGAYVRQGDVLAKAETDRLELRAAQAEAQVAAQRAVVERLRNGSRPEEIEQARANLAAAQADALNAGLQYERQVTLLDRDLTSQQEVDSAKAAVDAAEARVEAAEKALELLVEGPRDEDILQAEAQLQASEAELGLLGRMLEDATLIAPVHGVVRSRLLEPGDMASPERPVFSIAIMDPKWVRAYVSETNLGRIREGLPAHIDVDAYPDKRFEGRIGFISSVAEFTPKNVETEDLRTSLVYEVRVLVDDPANQLRLGMPATVRISTRAAADEIGEPVSEGPISPSSGGQDG